jgi:hypothetical protein
VNIRTDGINYKSLFLYTYTYVSRGRHSVNQFEDLQMKHFTLFFLSLSQRLFDRTTGNMTDENNEEKKKNMLEGSVCFRKKHEEGSS